MIQNDEQLAIVRKQLGHVERILESWRLELMPHNPRNFALYSEGCVEQIEILQAEIAEYLARKNTLAPGTNGAQSQVEQDPTTAS